MLRGEEGRQRKELDKLINWIRRETRPQIVHLSSVLLAGLARQVAGRLEVPVVCSLPATSFSTACRNHTVEWPGPCCANGAGTWRR